MTTVFQAIIYGIVHGFTIFLPVSWEAHSWLLHFIVGWEPPSPALSGALSAGAGLALLIYYRHDWASIVSSFLRVCLTLSKPMTLDERLPFFLALTAIPPALVWTFFQDQLTEIALSPLWVAGALVVFSLPFLLAERLNRKTKSMLDWNLLDSLIVGICQVLVLIPGAGRQIGALTGALLRNFNPEAAAKFGYLSFAPLLVAYSFSHLDAVAWGEPAPAPGLSWLSFGTALTVTLFAGLLSIGGFIKNVNQKKMRSYSVYRMVIAAGILVVFWIRG